MLMIYKIRKLLRRVIKNEKGAALVEYGMLVGLIALVCIAAVEALGIKIRDVFQAIVDRLIIPVG